MSSAPSALTRSELGALLDGWLEPARFQDVAENGLQVQGKDTIKRVVTGVSANLAFLEAAIAKGADAVVVHHGIVWGGIKRIDGWLHARVRTLITNDVSLFAYHLPLDAQPHWGNNAGIADALGLGERVPFGKYKGQLIGVAGSVGNAMHATLASVCADIQSRVGPVAHAFGPKDRRVQRIGVCTGGAPELLHDAIALGLDAYVTGEATEWVKAVAEESGTCFIAAGHHATERFGPRGLAAQLRASGVDAEFVDVENPA